MTHITRLHTKRFLYLVCAVTTLALASCGRSLPTAPDASEPAPAPVDTTSMIRPGAAPMYSTSAAMLAIMLDGSNYATDTQRGIRYFKWSPNGQTFQRSGFTPGAYRLSGMPVDGARVDEDASAWRYQCVALVKAKTWAPGTSSWHAGGRVVDGAGVAGNGIAIFNSSGVYVGTHACILLARYSDGSILVIEQNVPLGYGIRTRVIKRTNLGGVSDAASYRLIV